MATAGTPFDSASPLSLRLDDEDVLLTRREAAVLLRRSVATLERWAAEGEGPPLRKIGGGVLYPLPGLRRFARGEDTPPRAALRAREKRNPPRRAGRA